MRPPDKDVSGVSKQCIAAKKAWRKPIWNREPYLKALQARNVPKTPANSACCLNANEVFASQKTEAASLDILKVFVPNAAQCTGRVFGCRPPTVDAVSAAFGKK